MNYLPVILGSVIGTIAIQIWLAERMVVVFWNHGFDRSAQLHTKPLDFRGVISPFNQQ